ncbi:hypothetical protein [Francisella uliginis]|uniref:ABC-type transport auxiliary lipoprotein component domain-containing protein n=1 Tax=Francisella uliginis TaxID=573570 RepID=A0A1L4BV85_9GAMM|nr:hypothetical protein [Francisella uliginis]API87759.1 hypothetical protein F7310_03520 [Francisella uliginis]
MKKYLLTSLIIILPLKLFAFSLVGDPVKVPNEKEYIIYGKQIEEKSLPNTKNADINTTLLVYNIQTQVSKSTQMFYVENDQLHNFKNSVWAMPVSKMLTVATFEYILDNNIVNNLAFQNINIRQDFTLSGTTPYGPVLDLDHNQFFFYITFYLKNEKTGTAVIKTIKYNRKITSNDVSARRYAELTNIALAHILSDLKPWLIKNIREQKDNSKTLKSKPPTLFNVTTKQ